MTPRDPVYRVCMECGEVVNVSRFTRHDKKYLCPRCAGCPWFMTRVSKTRKEVKPLSSDKSM